MVTWFLLLIGIPLFLGMLSVVLDAVIERRYMREMERRRRYADAVLREWMRLQEGADMDAEEAIRQAEGIVREMRG